MKVTDTAGFTCGDILLIPDLKEAIVLAGAKGMHRPITRVNVMEVPDVIDWVRPGEFLITSGFPFRDRPEALADMIPQLAEKGVSALGIKIHRFINKIPERVLELADQYEFPIFELPSSTVFSDVVREVMERVLVQEARQLSLLQSRFQRMSRLLLHGGGIEEFLQHLDELLNNPVILIDNTDHMFLSPQAEHLAKPGSPVWFGSSESLHLGESFITIDGRRVRMYISGEGDKGEQSYKLMLLEWNQELSVADQLTVDRIGILISLEMLNAKARKEVEAKYVDQFLQDWMTGRIVTAADLRLRAEACGCPIGDNHSFQIVTVHWRKEPPAKKQIQQAIQQLRRRKADWKTIHLTLVDDEIVMLISYPPDSETAVNFTLNSVSAELPMLFAPDQGSHSFCIGKKVGKPEQVNESYEQATKIHRIAEAFGLQDLYIRYEQIGVYRLLYLLPDCDELREFRSRMIDPLLEYDQKHNSILIDTLNAYFRNNESMKKTADDLFTHYNTILYRIERVFELLKLDPNEANDRLQLHLAIKLLEMQRKEA